MPKFNEFIKGFEEKAETEQPKENRDQIIEKVNQKMMNANTYGAFGDKENYEKSIAEAEELRKGLAPKAEEPKDKGTPQTPARTFKPLSKAEAEDMRKGGFTEDEYRYNQAKDYAIAMGEEMPDKRKFTQELGEWKEANKQKAEEPNSQEYEGYRLERTPDGKWVNRDTYEYFDNKVEAQKDIDKFISSQSPNKPKQGSFEQVFGGGNEPRMLYVVYDTPQGKVGDYIELEPDMSEDDIIEQLKENKNVVGVYGGATNVGAIDPKWVRE